MAIRCRIKLMIIILVIGLALVGIGAFFYHHQMDLIPRKALDYFDEMNLIYGSEKAQQMTIEWLEGKFIVENAFWIGSLIWVEFITGHHRTSWRGITLD